MIIKWPLLILLLTASSALLHGIYAWIANRCMRSNEKGVFAQNPHLFILATRRFVIQLALATFAGAVCLYWFVVRTTS